MAVQLSSFKTIDNALALYYQRLGYGNYRNSDGNGIFLQHIIDEELIDDDLSIENELGDVCDPKHCAYSWMKNETEFPIPHYLVINDEQKEAFIFYVLQYCYKHNQPPSDQYIQQTLIPKVCGIISNTICPPNDSKAVTLMSEHKTSESDIKEFVDENEDDVMDRAQDAWLDEIVDDVIKIYDVLEFKRNPIGAKGNIYINKQFIKAWMNYVTPKFNDEAMMYYWLDYTTAMQMSQGYSKQYVNKENKTFMVAIINYELRDNQNNILYGIILCNDAKIKKQNDKYPYKLNTFMTKQQIHDEYGINAYDLPRKSRKNKDFIDKLLLKRRIVKQDLNAINWNNLKLYKSQSTDNDVVINKSIIITQKVMKEYCCIALERLNNNNNNNNKLIPIVVVDKNHNYYGIEWVLIVYIIHRNCYLGISFRYDDESNIFVATSIYLDTKEIESKHKLIGLKFDYCQHLKSFSSTKFKFKSAN